MLMSLPMIKYLVMGFKIFLTSKKCSCGQLIKTDSNECQECIRHRLDLPFLPPTCKCGVELPSRNAKTCDFCDPKSYRNVQLRKEFRMEYARLRALKDEREKNIPRNKIINASILVYDDKTGEIIGYKM